MRTKHGRAGMFVLAMTFASSSAAGAATFERDGELADRSGRLVFHLVSAEDAESVRLRVETRIDRGDVRWLFVDPEGREVFRARGTRGTVSADSGRVDSVPGSWRLELELDDVDGSYRIRGRDLREGDPPLEGSNDPDA